jgi:hypothetical protein
MDPTIRASMFLKAMMKQCEEAQGLQISQSDNAPDFA